MGGFFGAVCRRDVIGDVFFGTDYHSHLGTARGGMAAYDSEIGLKRKKAQSSHVFLRDCPDGRHIVIKAHASCG